MDEPSTPSVRLAIQPETGTICAGLTFIWRISVKAHPVRTANPNLWCGARRSRFVLLYCALEKKP
jgi:hypothetical protein